MPSLLINNLNFERLQEGSILEFTHVSVWPFQSVVKFTAANNVTTIHPLFQVNTPHGTGVDVQVLKNRLEEVGLDAKTIKKILTGLPTLIPEEEAHKTIVVDPNTEIKPPFTYVDA